GDTLRFIIRRRLPPSLRRQFDSDDFLQSVWGSFFTDRLEDYRFDSFEALLGFLVNVATNKVGDARRLLYAQKRDQNRTQSLTGSAAQTARYVIGPTPTPSALAVAEEEWDRLLRAQ